MLKILEHIVEQKSQQMGCPVTCRLYRVPPLDVSHCDRPRALMEQRKHLRVRLLRELEKKNYKHSKFFSGLKISRKARCSLDQKQKLLTPGLLSSSIHLLTLDQKQKLLTPGLLPKTLFASISLSHCSFVEGFIIAPTPKRAIGFDLESLGRVSQKIALRISSKEELNQVGINRTSITSTNFAPSPSALWSAKEAIYKSFSQGTRPIPMKQISVFNWKQQTDLKQIKNLYWAVLKFYSFFFSLPWISLKWKGRLFFTGPFSNNPKNVEVRINKWGLNKSKTFNKPEKAIFEIYDYQFKIIPTPARPGKNLTGKGFVFCFMPRQMVIAVAFLHDDPLDIV